MDRFKPGERLIFTNQATVDDVRAVILIGKQGAASWPYRVVSAVGPMGAAEGELRRCTLDEWLESP